MPGYRLDHRDADSQTGHGSWLDADSDQEAVLKARELRCAAQQCELWQGERLVARISTAGVVRLMDCR